MKGATSLIVLVAIIVIVGAVLLTPGVADSLSSVIAGPQLCSIAPYAWNCYCSIGMDKQPTGFGVGDIDFSYTCVPEIVPSTCNYPITYLGSFTLEFKELAYGCAKEIIEQKWSDCSSIGCDSPMWLDISVIAGEAGSSVYTHIMVECRDPQEIGGTTRWSTTFSMADGSLHPILDNSNFCK